MNFGNIIIMRTDTLTQSQETLRSGDPLINVDPKTVGKGVGVMIILKLLENIGNRAFPIITPPIMPIDNSTYKPQQTEL